MSYTSYQDMPGLLSRRREFTGNSASARWTGETYQVRSYSTVIATYSTATGWTVPEDYYSRTTTRLQNIVRRIA